MDKFQAAFEVLFLLAVIDRHLDEREVDVINQYVNANFGSGNYDTQATARSLTLLSPQGRLQELGQVANILNSVCSAQDKINLLDFVYRVILADRRITDEETSAFIALGDVWNIDVARFIDSR